MPGSERGQRGGLLKQSPHTWPATAQKITVNSREEFAARLRDLRVQSGAPSFRQLAKLTNYSSSTLADATSGRRLPTEPVLKALVSACGADPAPWLAELRRLAAVPARPDPEHGTDEIEMGPKGHGLPWHIPWQAAVAAAGALGFGAGIATGLLLAPPAVPRAGGVEASAQAVPQGAGPGVPAFSGTPTPAPKTTVSDGVDPVVGKCTGDSQLIDVAAVMRGAVQIGQLQLRYSPRCGAGWARLFLYPGEPTMMGEVTVRAGDGRYTVQADPLVKQMPDYTDVIVPGSGGCLGAYGQVYQEGMPVVTASVPCQNPTSGPAPGISRGPR
jgi:transcriptional regulator with XRE-family HTH domain